MPEAETPHVDPAPDLEVSPSVETAPAPPMPANYHVSIWDKPVPGYVCLLCPPDAPHLTLEAMQAHMPTAHDREAVPTATMAMLLTLRADDDARVAAAAALAARAVPSPTPEEASDAGRTDPDV